MLNRRVSFLSQLRQLHDERFDLHFVQPCFDCLAPRALAAPLLLLSALSFLKHYFNFN